MKKKPSQKPTARWVFLCLVGSTKVSIGDSPPVITDKQERQQVIIDVLGTLYQEICSPNLMRNVGLIPTHRLIWKPAPSRLRLKWRLMKESKGYIKPILHNVEVFSWKGDIERDGDGFIERQYRSHFRVCHRTV